MTDSQHGAWQPLDCHAHSTMSDGQLPVAEVVERVRARGVRPSISDHISTDVAGAVKTIAGVRDYLDELDRHDVARGGEFCWHDPLWRELPVELIVRFTHRIGSLHAIVLPDGSLVHCFVNELPATLDPQTYMNAHLENLERFAREMPVDILAHPTLLPIPFRRLPLEELWTEEREERAVEALFRSGIAFEISARYRAHERFIRRAYERGVRCSLGSDGHTAEQVGDLSFPLDMAHTVGIPSAELYDPRVHGSRTLAGR